MSSSDHTEELDVPGVSGDSFKITVNKDSFQDLEGAFHIFENEDKFLQFILRKCVNPPIKGKITNNKIRYRGLIVCKQRHNDNTTSTWIEQRGVRVGPIITI